MLGTPHILWTPLALPPLDSPTWQSPLRAFAWGIRSVVTTVLTLVLFATYLGIGALAHDSHFSLGWVLGSTILVWAGPAQIILISTLGSGATVVQAAIAVGVSAIRLFPMVVSVLPLLRKPETKRRHLVLAAHFFAVTLWVECFRLLPLVPRERRFAFTQAAGVIGSAADVKGSIDQNTQVQVQTGQTINELIGVANGSVAALNADLIRRLTQQSQVTQMLTYDAATSDPFK